MYDPVYTWSLSFCPQVPSSSHLKIVVEVTSPLGCVKKDSALVQVVPPPNVQLNPGDSSICQGSTLNFSVESSCLYTLSMYDTWGDGWNGQSLDIFENGVFIGNYTPESAGDYASGTNHTLPTNGFSKAYSGVNLDSFLKSITFQKITREGIQRIGKSIEIMAEVEGLQAHKNAVSLRLEEISKSNKITTLKSYDQKNV